MRIVLAAFLLLFSLGAQAELAIVVAKDSPVQKLDKREVADLFMARSNRLPGGKRVVTLELDDDAINAAFYRKISGKTLPQINSYWTTLIFTGKGHPPKKYSNRQHLIDVLQKDPYAITYLPLDQLNSSVRVVYTFR